MRAAKTDRVVRDASGLYTQIPYDMPGAFAALIVLDHPQVGTVVDGWWEPQQCTETLVEAATKVAE